MRRKGDDESPGGAAPGFIGSILDVVIAMGPLALVLIAALSLITIFAPEIMSAILHR